MLSTEDFFDLTKFTHRPLFEKTEYVWDVLKRLESYIQDTLDSNLGELRKKGDVLPETYALHEGKLIEHFTLKRGDTTKGKLQVEVDGEILVGASIFYAGASLLDDNIHVGKGTVVEPGALIKGPTIIGDNTEVRQGAYIRGNVIIGNRCVAGHTTEIKNSILIYGSKAGHFAYIGDSILGEVNLGAGTKLANLKIFESSIKVEIDGNQYDTGLRKMGAIIGDKVELGCNTVTSPGTLLAKGVLSYPNTSLRGYYPPGSIIKLKQEQEVIRTSV
jgi:carbonic anhydrase/acetyltransferase-like protein (isoleucine patch superfamily)